MMMIDFVLRNESTQW